MIKAEVIFDGNDMFCNGFELSENNDGTWVVFDYVSHDFNTLKEAIRYYLENV